MAVFRHSNKYIPEYVKPNLKWYKRNGNLMYFDGLKYKEFSNNPDRWFSNVKVVTLYIINYECRGDPLHNSYKNYKTIFKKILLIILKTKKQK